MKKVLVSAAALALSAGAASATTVFSDSFEDPQPANNWAVYQIVGDTAEWSKLDGVGIEIQTSGTVSYGGTPINAFDGDQYVELDADCERGGDPTVCGFSTEATNSAMVRFLDLSRGSYELTWAYLPRTDTEGDNTIAVYADATGAGVTTGTNQIGFEDDTQPADWQVITSSFVVKQDQVGEWAISFEGLGLDNEFGGFVDAVELSIVPLPAAGWMLLAGLGGMAALRRRQKS